MYVLRNKALNCLKIMRRLRWNIITFLLSLVIFLLAEHRLKSFTSIDNSLNMSSSMSYHRDITEESPEGYVNILDLSKPTFLDNYKNPCWKDTVGHGPKDNEQNCMCLAYFYYVGFPKTGSTDLYSELTKHPMILPIPKAPHWWSWTRIGYQLRRNGTHIYKATVPFQQYLNILNSNADVLHKTTASSNDGKTAIDFHPMIFGDASPSTMWSNFKWHSLPENQGQLMEEGPRFHVGHYIAHFTPNVRIIVTFRNPADREFSWYKYTGQGADSLSTQDFHDKVTVAIQAMKNCLNDRSPWSCVNDVSVTDVIPQRRTRLQLGMYVIWVNEWLKVFPRAHFHFSTLQDYSTNKTGVLHSICTFLDIDPLAMEMTKKGEWKNQANIKVNSIGDMFPETRALLDDFYKPFNMMLKDLLHDDKYIFPVS